MPATTLQRADEGYKTEDVLTALLASEGDEARALDWLRRSTTGGAFSVDGSSVIPPPASSAELESMATERAPPPPPTGSSALPPQVLYQRW